MTITVYTYDSGGTGSLPDGSDPDYSSLATFETDTDIDYDGYGLVILDCYNSQQHVISGKITFAGSTNVDEENRRIIRSAAEAGFKGYENTGACFLFNNTGAYYYALYIDEDHFEFNSMCISIQNDNATYSYAIYVYGLDTKLLNLVIHDCYNEGNGVGGIGFHVDGGGIAYNCMVKNIGVHPNHHETGDGQGIYFYGSYNYCAAVNNTVINADRGITFHYIPQRAHVIVNNLVQNTPTYCFDSVSGISSLSGWNLADDATADDINSTDYKNSTDVMTQLDENYLAKDDAILSYNGTSGDRAGISLLNHLTPYYDYNVFPNDGDGGHDVAVDTDQSKSGPVNMRCITTLFRKNTRKFKIKLTAHSTNDTVIDEVSIAIVNTSSGSFSSDTFSTTPVQVTFDGGNSGVTIPAGTEIESDWIEFNSFLNSKRVARIHIYSSESTFYYRAIRNYSYNQSYLESTAQNDCDTLDISGYSGETWHGPFSGFVVEEFPGILNWNYDIAGKPRSTEEDAEWMVGASGGLTKTIYTFDSGGAGSLPGGGDPDYSSFQTFESDTDLDYSGQGIICLDCYKSQVHEISSILQFSGATNTDYYNHRMLRSAPSIGFRGHEGTGAIIKGTGTTTGVINASDEPYLEFRDLNFSVQRAFASGYAGCLFIGGAGTRVINCVFFDCYNESNNTIALYLAVEGGTLVYNCIFKNIGTDANQSSGHYGYALYTPNNKKTQAVINCTVIDVKTWGFNGAGGSGQNVLLLNNLFQNCGTGCYETYSYYHSLSGWNLADDDTADNPNATNYKNNTDVLDQLDEYYHAKLGAVLSWNGGSGDNAGRSPKNDLQTQNMGFFPIDYDQPLNTQSKDRDRSIAGTANLRCQIPTSPVRLSRFKLKLTAHSTQNTIIDEASIGITSTIGSKSTTDFLATPVRITFNHGDYGITIAAGETIETDWITGIVIDQQRIARIHIYSEATTFYFRSHYDMFYNGYTLASTAQNDCFTNTLTGYATSTSNQGPVIELLGEGIQEPEWSKDILGVERSLTVDDQWNVGASHLGIQKAKGIQAFINT